MSDSTDDTTDAEEETYSLIRTVLGSTKRTDRWHLTDEVSVLTALGRAEFDLRGAVPTDSPVVEVSITCVLGGVSLWVPHGTLVVLDGTSFLASASSQVVPGDCDRLPRIEVTATTVLGRVRVRSLDDEPVALVETEPDAAVDEPVTADAVASPDPTAANDPVTPDPVAAPDPVEADPITPDPVTADAIAEDPVATPVGETGNDDPLAAAS